jgi:hypothetical protein
MGSHDREGRVGENAEQTLKKKYGKWKALVPSPSLSFNARLFLSHPDFTQLASNPSLEAQLMRAGGDALNDLGYTSPPSQARSDLHSTLCSHMTSSIFSSAVLRNALLLSLNVIPNPLVLRTGEMLLHLLHESHTPLSIAVLSLRQTILVET